MTFTKKTAGEAGKKGGKTGKLDGVGEYLTYLATGAARSYYTNLEKQFDGEDLEKPIKEAMDRFEKNTEFIAPKLSRRELKGDKDAPIMIILDE